MLKSLFGVSHYYYSINYLNNNEAKWLVRIYQIHKYEIFNR